MSTHYEKLRTAVFTGILLAGAGLAVCACTSDDNKNDTTIVIPHPDGSSTTGGTGGTGGTGEGGSAGTGGSTGGAAGTGGATGGAGGATGGAAGSGGSTGGGAGASGSGGAGGGGMDSGSPDTGGGMCPASGSYDNSMLPLLPDGGLPPL
jgi:hypothetical protein